MNQPFENAEYPDYPIVQVKVEDGSIDIIGVWGTCDMDMLRDIEEDMDNYFHDSNLSCIHTIQITGRCEEYYDQVKHEFYSEGNYDWEVLGGDCPENQQEKMIDGNV